MPNLLIKTNEENETPERRVGQWNELPNVPTFIENIKTASINTHENGENSDVDSLISGFPSPWARVKLFCKSLENPKGTYREGDAFQEIYRTLQGEWRGLLAVMAIYPDRITLSHAIQLSETTDREDKLDNIPEIFGQMLFDDKKLWPNSEAFIQLIYYRGHLIGGTSPMTVCFTGVDYTIGGDADITWYNGKIFTDPTNSLTNEQLRKLYLFISNLDHNLTISPDPEHNLPALIDQLPQENRDNLNKLHRELSRWKEEIKKLDPHVPEKGPVPKFDVPDRKFEYPYSVLLKSDVPVYYDIDDALFTYTPRKKPEAYERINDIQDFLSTDHYLLGWEGLNLENAPLYYLPIKDLEKGCTYYFSIPLSEEGLERFKVRINSLLRYDSQNGGLSATLSSDGKVISVTLTVLIDGQLVRTPGREYEIKWMQNSEPVILWPDFKSQNWQAYYLYTEYINSSEVQFDPIFLDFSDRLEEGDSTFYIKTGDDSHFCTPKDEPSFVKKIVRYPAGEVDDFKRKYEIYRSEKPVAGLWVKLQEKGEDFRAGFLLLKDDQNPIINEDFRDTVGIGIDFGSNNTCVYYTTEKSNEIGPVQFKNYRMILIGGPENTGRKTVAEANELLFFPSYESDNGQLKSWLHEQDERYTKRTDLKSNAVTGGALVNRPNIKVEAMDERKITTNEGILHYNMKWLTDENGEEKKEAYLNMVWLETCAYLFKNHQKPKILFWSFPGAMREKEKTKLGNIYGNVVLKTPIVEDTKGVGKMEPLPICINKKRTDERGHSITEAEAVFTFATNNADRGLGTNSLFLGIDVGGSTSDIMLMATDAGESTLIAESSIRLSAGAFFNAVKDSPQFRRALVEFNDLNQDIVYVSGIKSIKTDGSKAPFYLNSIFDQLITKENYDRFYNFIWRRSRFVLTIPAYVSGLLLFYSGIMIGQKIKNGNNINEIDIMAMGKGGRIFHWLNAINSDLTEKYYRDCLIKGIEVCLKKPVEQHELKVVFREDIERDNKAEVAKGLCELARESLIAEKTDNNKDSVSQLEKSYTEKDLCGEEGVQLLDLESNKYKSLDTCTELDGSCFEGNLRRLDFSNIDVNKDQPSNFKQFFEIFADFVSHQIELCSDITDRLRTELDNLPVNIKNDIRNNDSEYREALKNSNTGKFEYHQPIIIAEGCRFLTSLIDKIFKIQ